MAGPRPPDPRYPKELRSLGDRLRARRLDLGLSQDQVAQSFSVTPFTVRNWELGATLPLGRFRAAIRAFLDDSTPGGGQSFAESCTWVRWALGLTQKELAATLGVNRSTVVDWERGHHRPTAEHRRRIEGMLAGAGAFPNSPLGSSWAADGQ